MRYGICTSASGSGAPLRASAADFVEENVQGFLKPREADEAAFQARLTAAQACGKPILAANCFLPGDPKCVGPAVDRPAIRAYAETAFRRAAQAGIRVIVFGSGGSRNIPDGFPRERAVVQFTALLCELAPLAAAHGVTLVVEPLNRGECNLVNSVDEGADIVRAVNHQGVRLLADVYHMRRDGEGPDAIARNRDLLAHVHVAELQDRAAPGTAGEDLRPWLAELAEGYDGAISIECGWKDLSAQLPAALECLREQAECLAAAAH
jgi:sugar phosphate isomerase/epimerase